MRRVQVWIADIVLVLASAAVALELRYGFDVGSAQVQSSARFLVEVVIAWAFISWLMVTHASVWRFSSIEDVSRIARACLASVGVATAAEFIVNRLDGVARSIPPLLVLTMMASLLGARLVFRQLNSYRLGRLSLQEGAATNPEKCVLVVGHGALSQFYLAAVHDNPAVRIHVAGIVTHRADKVGRMIRGVPVLGVIDNLESVLHRLKIEGVTVDELVIAVGSRNASDAVETVEFAESRAEHLGIPAVRVDTLLSGRSLARASDAATEAAVNQDEHPLSVLDHPTGITQERSVYRYFKRGMDIVVSLVGLICLTPLFLLLAVVIAIEIGMPVVFRQRRMGVNGHPFWCFKFKTMRDPIGSGGKRLSEQERNSVVGAVLRRLRIDELLQLYNVLRGEMSLAGPRPLLPIDQPPNSHWRLNLRPGLTGWAQVCGGREVSLSDKAALDYWYLQKASLRTDMEIFARTIGVVVYGERIDPKALMAARALHVAAPRALTQRVDENFA